MRRRTFLGMSISLFFLPSICLSNQVKPVVKKPIGIRIGKEFVYNKVNVKVVYNEEYPSINEASYILFIKEDTNINADIFDVCRSLSKSAKEQNKNIVIYVTTKYIIGYIK